LTTAYVDSSLLVAVAFREEDHERHVARLDGTRRLVSSNLLEAEVRSALIRELTFAVPPLLGRLEWIFPDRVLTREIERVLAVGRLRGADLWHVATALYLAPNPGEMTFLTVDQPQREVAAAVGFRV
jgi:predicted nucleic acid-binding protein